MDFKTTSTKARRGFTLIELMFSIAVSGLVVTAMASFTYFSARSMAAMVNYVDLETYNRRAMDQMTRDIRQANRLLGYAENIMLLQDADNNYLYYYYYYPAKTVYRIKGSSFRVYLEGCDEMRFRYYQRNPVGASFEVFPMMTTLETCKLIDVRWVCSRTIFGRKMNTESVQTSRIVIRKQ